MPGFDTTAWQMLVAPGKTPRPILDKLNAEVNAIVHTDEITKQFVGLGLVPIGKGSLEELDAFVKSETVRWAQGDHGAPASRDAVAGSIECKGVDDVVTANAALLVALGLIRRSASCAMAEDYPTRPITIIVPYASGGSTEILARMVGQKLEERHRQSRW